MILVDRAIKAVKNKVAGYRCSKKGHRICEGYDKREDGTKVLIRKCQDCSFEERHDAA